MTDDRMCLSRINSAFKTLGLLRILGNFDYTEEAHGRVSKWDAVRIGTEGLLHRGGVTHCGRGGL